MATNGKILTVGTSATDLDIFVTAGQNGLPLDPTSIRFRIFDPLGMEAITETDGTRVSTGRFNASAATIPSGFQLGDNWKIQWDIVTSSTSGSSSELFCVENSQLTLNFNNPNEASLESIYDKVRLDIGDPDGMIFTDVLMQRTIKKAVSRVNRKLGLVRLAQDSHYIFFISFQCRTSTPTLTLDVQNGTISPDTDPYVDIVVLQMEEILLTSESVALQRLNSATAGAFGSGIVGAASDGVSVTDVDGTSISKAMGRLSHRSDMAKFNLNNIRSELEMAIKDLRWRLSGSSGKDVTMPRYHNYGGYGRNGYYRGC